MANGDDIVAYTVKEILIRLDSKVDALDAKFDLVDAKLESKADRTRVHDIANDLMGLRTEVKVLDSTAIKRGGRDHEELVGRVDLLELEGSRPTQANTRRIAVLETGMADMAMFVGGLKAVAKYKRWLIATAIGFATIGVGVLTALATIIWLKIG